MLSYRQKTNLNFPFKTLFTISFIMIGFGSCNNAPNEAKEPSFSHVYLTVADLEASITFYTDVFKLKEVNRIQKLTQTKLDGTTKDIEVNMAFLKFMGHNFQLEIGEKPKFKAVNDSANLAHIGIEVVDIEASHKKLLKAGATLIRDIMHVQAEDIKVKNAFYRGLDGETIELLQFLSKGIE